MAMEKKGMGFLFWAIKECCYEWMRTSCVSAGVIIEFSFIIRSWLLLVLEKMDKFNGCRV